MRGTDDCSVHAACVNTEGHFKCKCHRGYLGDGRVCAPAPIHLDVIKSSFYTNDTINCAVSGQPVPYPKWAPGWVYDPTGLFDDSYDGNRVAVTLTQCKTACLMADDCTSFFWDAGQKKCLLRKDECPFISANVPGCQAQGSGIPVPTICTDGAKYTFNSPAPPTREVALRPLPPPAPPPRMLKCPPPLVPCVQRCPPTSAALPSPTSRGTPSCRRGARRTRRTLDARGERRTRCRPTPCRGHNSFCDTQSVRHQAPPLVAFFLLVY